METTISGLGYIIVVSIFFSIFPISRRGHSGPTSSPACASKPGKRHLVSTVLREKIIVKLASAARNAH